MSTSRLCLYRNGAPRRGWVTSATITWHRYLVPEKERVLSSVK